MDICLQVLKESNKSSFDSYSVRDSELIISYIIFRDGRVLARENSRHLATLPLVFPPNSV